MAFTVRRLRPIRKRSGLLRDRRAASAIEFTLVAAPLVALIVAILQTALIFFAQQVLQSSAEETARQLITGTAQSSSMTQATFSAAACKTLPAFMSCSNMMIDVQSAASFATINTAAPTLTYDSNGNLTNSWAFSPGGPGSVVIMRMMYRLPVVGGPLGFNLSNMNGNRRLLIATSVFKTEPYGSGS